MQPHRSSAMHDAAAILTVARTRVVAMPLSWSWSHQTQRRACAAALALRDTLIRTPYLLTPGGGPAPAFYLHNSSANQLQLSSDLWKYHRIPGPTSDQDKI